MRCSGLAWSGSTELCTGRPRGPARCWLLVVVLTLAGCAAPYPHTQWDRWTAASTPVTPGATWSKYASPEQAAWSSAGLADAEAFSRRIGSAAVMVVFDGAVLAHWGEIERRFNVHSVRKSLLSALYGIAAARGEIDLDQSLADLGIDDRRPLSEIEKSARVVDLLSARSGFYLPAAYESPSMRSERPRRGTVRPGERWYYDNWDFNALGTIYRERTGRDLFEAFAEDLARPIQMQDFAPRHGY